MSDRLPSLTHAALRFLGLYVLAVLAWALVLGPSYDTLVAVMGGQVVRSLESPRMTAGISVDGPYAVVSHTAAFADVPEQRLELRTHHNNLPLLVALILATPAMSGRQRLRALAVAVAVLWTTHVVHFMLTVQVHYAFFNVGPYRVTDLGILDAGLLESLSRGAQALKLILGHVQSFYTHVGRRVAPILIWLVVCAEPLRAYGRELAATRG